MQTESISLYYRDGGSDKVYHVQLEPATTDGTGWIVNFQYGRRGQTLHTGTKTSQPIAFDKAKKTYDKLIKEKMAKGYTPGEDGTPFAGTDKAGEVSGLVPQLLNIVDDKTCESLINNVNYLMQEKKDGTRLMVRKKDGVITGSNRKGLVIPISTKIEERLLKIPGDFELDGEAVGDVYWVFDILSCGDQDFRDDSVMNRWSAVCELTQKIDIDGSAVQVVPSMFTSRLKAKYYSTLLEDKAEGVVFKHLLAKYVPGRPASGGNQLKFKFKASVTCEVVQHNGTKRSVLLGLNDAGLGTDQYREVGNVTIPSNYEIPAVGTFVEVEYLYAFPGGSLFQPVYKGPRPDKDVADMYSSLKFKQGTTEDDDA